MKDYIYIFGVSVNCRYNDLYAFVQRGLLQRGVVYITQLLEDFVVRGKKEKTVEEKKFPRTKIQWMWDNMEGRRALFVIAILGTITYNAMQLVIPMFSGKIVDEFISGENAAYNLANNRDRLLFLIALMVGATLLRTVIVYLDCIS